MKITKNNYFEIIDKFGVKNLPKELQEGHSYIEQATENNSDWTMYNDGGNVKKVIDRHFGFIEEFLNKREKGNHNQQKETARKPSPKKADKTPQANKGFKLVRHLTEEVKFIKRFVGLHNRKKTAAAILNFLKAVQRSITQKLISKDSPFVKQVEYVQDELIKIYNAIDKKRSKEGTIEIPEKDLSKLVGISGGEAVYPSVGFIRQFIGMQGKVIGAEKKDNYISRLERAAKNQKITKGDPFSDKLQWIYKYLKPLQSDKKIQISKSELNGLECICNNCDKELGRIYDTKGKPLRKCSSGKYSDAGKGACSYNRGLGKIYDTKGRPLRKCKSGKYSDARKGACSYNKGLSGIMSAQEVANMQFKLLPFTGIWKETFGSPEKNFTLMIHGEPGAGKSTALVKFTKYLSGLGSVLYVTPEEYRSVTMQNLVNKYLYPVPFNVTFAADLSEANPADYDFVIFDSVNALRLTIDEFVQMKKGCPGTAFIYVLQNTKDGQFRGGKEWEHEAQIAAEVSNGNMQVYKNRYGIKGNWYFFDQDEQDYRIAA
jgi:hypothetical protein